MGAQRKKSKAKALEILQIYKNQTSRGLAF